MRDDKPHHLSEIGTLPFSLQYLALPVDFIFPSCINYILLKFRQCDADNIEQIAKNSATDQLSKHSYAHFIFVLRSYIAISYSHYGGYGPI
jgi:hypothetical protein